jgi:predicted NAD/FAD-binding protein
MSFSVRCSRSGLEYNGSSLNGLFAQRRNLLRPAFHRMIKDILRFNREAPALLDQVGELDTVGEFLRRYRYSDNFANHYLLPMGAAIWSCPTETFERFPIRFIIEFYHNHGLLSLKDRPTWRVIRGGSRSYVDALTASFRDRIRLNSPVAAVFRHDDSVDVSSVDGQCELFDEVVFACHSDQALRILSHDATTAEREVLTAIPYEPNTAVLHTDASLLPRRRRAWASWNYHIPKGQSNHATLTYNMNILQHIKSAETICVTLNEDSAVDPKKVLARFRYSHPVFTTERAAAQKRQCELIRTNRTSFCGAYWGNGFHEDGVNSAIAVTNAFSMPVTGERRVLSHA